MLPLHQNARVAAKQVHVQNGIGKQSADFLRFQPLRNGFYSSRMAGVIEP